MDEEAEESTKPARKSKVPLPFVLITRKKWGATAGETPKNQRLKYPANFVRFVETTTTTEGYDDCSEYMREVQKFRINTGDTDIPYNFVIGPDNVAYEGLGWKMDVGPGRGLKLKYLTGDCVDIAFIGSLEEGFMPTSEMFKVAIDIIKYGLEMNYISPTYLQIPIDGWRPSYFLKPHR
uniref:Peptidoglycan recognition protein 1 n=1 Tax=Nephotettix cincticeps TaxID=94400 RepID=A0A5H2WUN3_NEPCI|nr:peptidoglycan recognition protein 1 [Nephotettix cincticeps]